MTAGTTLESGKPVHAMAIVQTLRDATLPKVSTEDPPAQRFAGEKAQWHEPFDALMTKMKAFGLQVAISPASIAITLDLYSHVLPDMQQEATAAMERIFSK
jgi:hypothetical protein